MSPGNSSKLVKKENSEVSGTLHVPLTRGGSDPTWHLIGGRELATLGNGALLV